MSNDKIARKLLDGSSCTNCQHYDQVLFKCKILHPIKVKYPKDVEIFKNGMLVFQGEDANHSDVFVIGDEVHFKQVYISLVEFDQITIYSRGIDEDGKYDTEIHNIVHRYKNMPEGSICEDHFKMGGV